MIFSVIYIISLWIVEFFGSKVLYGSGTIDSPIVNKEEIKTAKTNCFYHLLFQAQVSWQGSAAKHEPLRQANLPCRLLHTS